LNNKILVKEIVLNLIVIFSGFFIIKIPIDPVYIFFSLGSFIFLTLILIKKRVYLDEINVLIVTFVIYLIFSQTLNDGDVKNLFLVVFSLLFYFLVSNLVIGLDKLSIKKLSLRFINASIFLLIVEALYRLTNPLYFVNPNLIDRSDYFYFYKMNSIMYQDSNFVGMFILPLYFFSEFLEDEFEEQYIFRKTVLFILCFLTLSRAVIISLIIFKVILLFKNHIRKYFFVILPFISILIFYIFYYIRNDSSFASKLFIFEKTYLFLTNYSVQDILFGVGFGNSINVIGIGAHNIISTYLIESGIIGFAFLTIIWLIILFRSNWALFYIMFSYLLASMSLTSHAIPYLYVIFALTIFSVNFKKFNHIPNDFIEGDNLNL